MTNEARITFRPASAQTLTSGPVEIEVNGIKIMGYYNADDETWTAFKEEVERYKRALEQKKKEKAAEQKLRAWSRK